MGLIKFLHKENVYSLVERKATKLYFIQLVILLFLFFTASIVAAETYSRCNSNDSSNSGLCLGEVVWDEFGVFEGLIKNGEPMNGTIKYNNGEYYEGDVFKTRPHGTGKYIYENGTIYEGEILHGFSFGKGTTKFPNGDVYTGYFKNNLFDGKGTYLYADGEKHVGNYIGGERVGKGTYFYADGATFKGDYVDGKAVFGKYNHGPNSSFAGSWYEGEFANDNYHGSGTYFYADGATLKGDFVNGQATGFGTLIRGPDSNLAGERYEGEFLNYFFQGYGKYTYADGTFVKGFYEKNIQVNVTFGFCSLQNLQTCTDDDICFAATRPVNQSSKTIVWDDLLGSAYRVEAESRKLNCISGSNLAEKTTPSTPNVDVEKTTPNTKMALVIGNASYEDQPTLANPIADAHLISSTLRSLGFQVTTSLDLNRKEMIQELIRYKNSLVGATVSLIYFAGHGIEISKTNYLMPVDSIGTNLDLIKYEAIPLDDLISITQLATKLSVILVDSCRNNPFLNRVSSRTRSTLRGLQMVDINPEGAQNQIISFATSSGEFAEDGQTSNSPYAKVLAGLLAEPKLEIGKLFRILGDEVFKNTGGRQRPMTRNHLGSSDIFLNEL